MASFTLRSSRVISGGSDHIEENHVVRLTQWMKAYPYSTFGQAGPTPVIFIFSLLFLF
jgi:hypothetical protein